MSAEGGQLDEEVHIFARLTRHANRVDHERITIEGDVERMQTLLVLMVGVKSPKTEKSIKNIDYFQKLSVFLNFYCRFGGKMIDF